MNNNANLKSSLRKTMRICGLFLLVIALITLLFALGLWIYHSIKSSKEKKSMNPLGQKVEVNGHEMHVMTGGKADSKVTVVFIHSAKVVDDSVALQPLMNQISDTTAYAYVDRAGYGYSESAGTSRDIDNMLEETREALSKAGVKAPYVLAPTGTGTLEALYWINKYPKEVVGLFGMDITTAESFDEMKQEDYAGFSGWLFSKLVSIGGARLINNIDAVDYGKVYNNAQMRERNALIAQGAYTSDMYAEDKATLENAKKVKALGWPKDMEIELLFANEAMEPYVNQDSQVKEQVDKIKKDDPKADVVGNYNQMAYEYFKDYTNVTIKELAGPYRIYTYSPKEVAKELKNYLEKIEE